MERIIGIKGYFGEKAFKLAILKLKQYPHYGMRTWREPGHWKVNLRSKLGWNWKSTWIRGS